MQLDQVGFGDIFTANCNLTKCKQAETSQEAVFKKFEGAMNLKNEVDTLQASITSKEETASKLEQQGAKGAEQTKYISQLRDEAAKLKSQLNAKQGQVNVKNAEQGKAEQAKLTQCKEQTKTAQSVLDRTYREDGKQRADAQSALGKANAEISKYKAKESPSYVMLLNGETSYQMYDAVDKMVEDLGKLSSYNKTETAYDNIKTAVINGVNNLYDESRNLEVHAQVASVVESVMNVATNIPVIGGALGGAIAIGQDLADAYMNNGGKINGADVGKALADGVANAAISYGTGKLGKILPDTKIAEQVVDKLGSKVLDSTCNFAVNAIKTTAQQVTNEMINSGEINLGDAVKNGAKTGFVYAMPGGDYLAQSNLELANTKIPDKLVNGGGHDF